MAHSTVAELPNGVRTPLGTTDVLVFRRASGGRFVLTGPHPEGVTGELLVDDEPIVRQALADRVRRVACEQPVNVCGGYTACAAAVVSVDPDVIVILGRRDGCLAGVSDHALLEVATDAALAQARGV